MNDSLVLAIILLSFLVIAVLGGIIVKQKQTINDYKHPRYGFLGKKLAAYILFISFVALGGIYLYPPSNAIQTSVSVSDTMPSVELEIIYNLINANDLTYEFILVPKINGVEWEGQNSIFEVMWEINGEFSSEFISKESPGGILKQLDSGNNTIRVNLYYQNQSFTKELQIIN